MSEEVNFVEVVKPSLPEDLYDDKLAVMLQILIGKVKNDHSKSGFKTDIRQYAPFITGVVQFARENGYQKVVEIKEKEALNTDTTDENKKEPENSELKKDDIDWDSLI